MDTLREDIARLNRALALPDGERVKWAAGIAKLEQRIEEERRACGMDLHTIGAMICEAIEGAAGRDVEALTAAFDQVDEAYRVGDTDAMERAMRALRGG